MLPLDVALPVLFAALLHAGWNALAKRGGEPVLDLALVFGGAGAIALALLPFAPAPAPESWPWIAASALVHAVYVMLLALAYRAGDLSHVYPLMRGTPLLIVGIVASAWIGESLGLQGWLGIALISGGILSLGIGPRATWRATSLAFLTASTTAAYTVIDGLGTRAAGSAVAFVLWMFPLASIAALALAAALDGRTLPGHLRRHWRRALLGGGASLLGYGIILWAMSRAPIALVAALRETSVVFATLLGAFWLGEPVGRRRVAAALAVATGAAALKLA